MQRYLCSGLEQRANSIASDGMESFFRKQATASLHPEVERQSRTILQGSTGATSQPPTSSYLHQPASSRARIATSVDDRRSGFTQSMLQKHQEITELLINQQKSQHLPPRDIFTTT